MGSRFPSHQLHNGLYVSGRPEQPKEKTQTTSFVAMPYTGGDIKKSGELGKMLHVPVDGSKSRKSGPLTGATSRTGSFPGNVSHAGPINPNNANVRANYIASGPVASVMANKTKSGSLNRHGEPIKVSGPQPPVLQATGLITSGPLNSTGAPRKASGPCTVNNQAVTTLIQRDDFSFRKNLPKHILWAMVLLFVMGFIAGGFILGAVHNAILLVVVTVLFAIVAVLFLWNSCWGKRAVGSFIGRYPDAELRTAQNGQYVKVSGVVTCGNVTLESSFQRVPRCVYTSTSLYEYQGLDLKATDTKPRCFAWGLRSSEKQVVDFYISDIRSGFRALVKAGHGARVTPYVEETMVIDANSSEFIRWLRERKLSSDDHTMRLKEGYIKEGNTVSVMGVVQRNGNTLTIVPPPEPLATGCQWMKCIFPASLEGIVLRCEDVSMNDVIPV